MKLVACLHCGASVPRTALTCLKCGAPPPQEFFDDDTGGTWGDFSDALGRVSEFYRESPTDLPIERLTKDWLITRITDRMTFAAGSTNLRYQIPRFGILTYLAVRATRPLAAEFRITTDGRIVIVSIPMVEFPVSFNVILDLNYSQEVEVEIDTRSAKLERDCSVDFYRRTILPLRA